MLYVLNSVITTLYVSYLIKITFVLTYDIFLILYYITDDVFVKGNQNLKKI